MKSLIKRSVQFGIVVAFLALFSQAVMAQSTDLDINATVDNQITMLISTDDTVPGVSIFVDPTWEQPTFQRVPLTGPAQPWYIHVLGENTGGPAMFLGGFSLSNDRYKFANGTRSLLTGDAGWMVGVTDWTTARTAPVDLGPNDGTSATWAAGYGGTPPTLASIDPTARFIWHELLDDAPTVAFSAAIIPTEADIEITSVETTVDPLIAGSGTDNLVYEFTVTNNGPDDATNLVIDITTVPGAGLAGICGLDTSPPATADDVTWNIGSLGNGDSATYTKTCTITADAAHGSTYSQTHTVGSVDQINAPGNDSAAEDTTVIRVATWDVSKVWDGGEVDVQLTCGGSVVDSATTSGLAATLTYTGFADAVNCIVTETVPVGQAPNYVGDCDVASTVSGNGYSCVITNSTSEARIHVTKWFSDNNPSEVTVNVECNDGFISQNGVAEVAPGPIGHTFIITDFVDGAMDCTVTETGSPSGYITMPVGGFEFLGMDSDPGFYQANFTNMARDAEYTVTKEWMITNSGGNVVDEEVYVTIECDSPIDQAYDQAIPIPCLDDCGGPYTKSAWLGDGDKLTASVSTLTGPAMCKASEDDVQSGVDVENGCASYETLTAGEKYGCTIYNSVFFEGIPTLSQYGLALMALLMLGVGFIGFRRFI